MCAQPQVLLPERLPGRLLLRPTGARFARPHVSLRLQGEAYRGATRDQEGLIEILNCPISSAMSDPYFFGYGSLVNRQTHSFPDARTARVRGWRRAWQGTSLRKVAFLTAVPDSTGEIAGLVAAVPGADWGALDERERAYARHPVIASDHGLSDLAQVQIYAVEPAHIDAGAHPILLSYLDTVIQGYLTEFGTAGAQAFFDTTDGWHFPVLDDRSDPVYPRATVLSDEERAFVDDHLQRVTQRAR